MANKRPARVNFGLDLDPDVITRAATVISNDGYQFICDDATRWLRAANLTPDTLVYCDPPYLPSTRRQQRPIYRCEMARNDHVNLLSVLVELDCMVIVSGYWSKLYADMLAGWRTETFTAVTRGGNTATEWLWMNYPEPHSLHDYRYLGADYRERERIKRKVGRWVAGLERMNRLERQAIISAVIAEFGDTFRIQSPHLAMKGNTVKSTVAPVPSKTTMAAPIATSNDNCRQLPLDIAMLTADKP